MKLPGDGFNWRRLTKRQIAMGISLLVLIITSVSVTALVIRPAGAATALTKRPPKEHDDPRAAGKYFQLRHYGATLPAPDAPAKAQAQARTIPQFPTKWVSSGKKATAGTTTATWRAIGPAPEDYSTCTNVNFCTGPYGHNTGRITALAVDPGNSSNLWVGTADGGLWHSTDGGAHYTPMSDTWQTLAIGSIAIDPNNHNTVYVGTGEANFNADGYWGAGIYKTTNGGSNWTQLGFNKFGGMSIGKLAVDPNDSNNILAAVAMNGGFSAANTPPGGATSATSNGGIWESIDGGSTWSQVLADTSSLKLDFGTDVVFDPAHSGVVYAGLGNGFGIQSGGSYISRAGVYKSTSSGNSGSWTQLTSGANALPTGDSIQRVSLGLSNDGNTLYVVLTDSDVTTSGQPNFGALLSGSIWVSTNANTALTFVSHLVPADMADASGGFQYWYDVYSMVDPTNANTAYVGGVDIWQTTNGGTSWTNLTNAYAVTPGNVHPDQHALAFFSSSLSDYYAGNDGGVWKNVSGSFTNLNDGGLNITQFYAGSYGDVGGASGTLYGGAQDNGELQYSGSTSSGPTTWNQAAGGDGGYTAVDYTNNNVVYGEFPFGLMYKSNDGGATWGIVDPVGQFDDVNFIMPFVMSPTNHDTLFAGSDRVYRTTNGASSWSAISGKLDPNTSGFNAEISALAVAPTSDNVIYAGLNSGKFYRTTDGGAHWANLAIPGSTGGVLTSIAVDPTNASIVYATFADFASGAGHHVFKSTNYGSNWTDISAGLPNIPFESVLLTGSSGSSQKVLIAGSDAGIFASEDQGTTWYTLGAGLPNVAINQVFTSHDGAKLFVATHGRGMWELSTGALQVTPSTPITATVGVGSTTGSISGHYSQTITVKNAGSSAMNWSINDGAFPSCLSATPDQDTLAANASEVVTLSVDTATAGTCAANVTVTADGLIPSVTIPVAVEVSDLSKTWYFAEGYTGKGFDEWLTLANPGNAPASVTVTYLIQNLAPRVRTYSVNPKSRFTVKVNDAIGPQNRVSMAISSTQPIIAERPMYVQYGLGSTQIPGGTSLMGSPTLGTDYFFGYVDITANHDTWFTILNQNSEILTMTVDFYRSDGTHLLRTHTVAANSRGSFKVNDEGLGAGVYSAHIHFGTPGHDQVALVERPMYFKDNATGRPGITDVLGVSAPQTTWTFAEGQQDGNHRELYILANQQGSPTTYTISFYNDDGSTGSTSGTIEAHQQAIVLTNGLPGVGAVHGARVTASQPILADRLISAHYHGPLGTGSTIYLVDGATDSTGTADAQQAYYFAEGYTGGKSIEFLELANPSGSATVTVTVSYLPSNGSAAVVRVYTLAAHSRLTIDTRTVMPGTSFSLAVLSDQPLVAERTMVFIYGLPSGSSTINLPGMNVAVGYQP